MDHALDQPADSTGQTSDNAPLISSTQEMITQRRRQIGAGGSASALNSSGQTNKLPYRKDKNDSMGWVTPLAAISGLLIIVVFVVYMLNGSKSSENASISKSHTKMDSDANDGGPTVKVTDDRGSAAIVKAADLVRARSAELRDSRNTHLDRQKERFAELRNKFDELNQYKDNDNRDDRVDDKEDLMSRHRRKDKEHAMLRERGEIPDRFDRDRLSAGLDRIGSRGTNRDRIIDEFEKENLDIRKEMVELKNSMRDTNDKDQRDELMSKLKELRQRQKDLHSEHREKLREGMRLDRESRRSRIRDHGSDNQDDLPGLDLSDMEDRREQLLRRRRDRMGSDDEWLRPGRDRHRPRRPCTDIGSDSVCEAAVQSGDCAKLRGVCDKSCGFCKEISKDGEDDSEAKILLHERIKEDRRFRERGRDRDLGRDYDSRRSRRERRDRFDRRERASPVFRDGERRENEGVARGDNKEDDGFKRDQGSDDRIRQ